MQKGRLLPVIALAMAFSVLGAWAAEQPAPPPERARVDEAAAAKELAEICAKLTCRKASRTMTLRMPDKTNFQITTRPLPYFDDKGQLILFAGESVTLSYAGGDEKLAHPAVSSVRDPLGPVELPAPLSDATITFDLKQMDGQPGMMMTVTNKTKTIIKYDAVMFVPDPASGGARGARTSACPVLPPQGTSTTFSAFENWPQPIVMLLISNIRVLPAGAPQVCN
jgi:hypothetical protein